MNKYINKTKENIKVRIGTLNNYIWKTIKPNEMIELEWFIGDNYRLVKLADSNEEKKESDIKEKQSKGVDELSPESILIASNQLPSKSDTKAYKKKLIDIKGVGKKIAKEIMEKYPTEDILIMAIHEGQEVHVHDGVDKHIKEKFN